jgi:DNA-binding CsgD family transcriptional regulator/tetratricopeptide (TPR) repeat protein
VAHEPMADKALDVADRAELDALARFLAGASTEPHALVVEGEAGIGKTTVWLAAQEQARDQGFQVLSARPAQAETVLAYATLADLLTRVDPAAWTNLPHPQRLAIDRVMLRATDNDVPADPRAAGAALLAIVEELGRQKKVVLAIDDLQWVDSSSASAIAFAARRVSGPVGVLAAFRTAQTENPGAWLQLYRPDVTHRIELQPMKLGALHRVVSQRLGRSFARPTMVRIHEVSGGNPLYAIELARTIDDATTNANLRLPPTLAQLVHARLGDLESDTQDLVLAAACAAEPTVELLATAVRRNADDLRRLLEEAEPPGILVLDGHRVRFSHPLLASGVYTGAAPTRRRTMHRRLAEIVIDPELKARHLALAATQGDPATLESLDAAAQIARIRGAPAAAAELIDLAIGLGGDTPERRILSAAHHFNAGDAATARSILQQTVGHAAPRPLRAEALNLLAVISQLEGSLLDGADQLERALTDAGNDLVLRVQILVSLSWIQIHIGQHTASAQNIAEAVADAAELGQPQLLSQALGMRAVVHFLLGRGVEESVLQRALELEDRDTAITVMFRPTFHIALVWASTGQFDAAHDQFIAVWQNCIDRGEESELVFVAFHSVLNELWRADFRHAARIAEDTVERARQLDGALPISAALTVRALLSVYAGREDDVRRDTSEAIGPMVQSGSQILTTWTVATMGFLDVSLGNYEEAINRFEPLLDRVMAAPHMTEIYIAWFLPDAIEALIRVGRAVEAEPLIEALERNGRRLDRPWMLAVGARCRAMFMAAHGDLKAAMVAVEAAMIEHDRLPMPFERARTQLLLGQIQRRRRMKSVASETLQSVLQTFEELETPLWAEHTRAELARVKVGPQPTDGLTASEQRVGELAASGMTNREVAAALSISPKTVESNLMHIYRKLGIRSRAELGRRIHSPKTPL